MKHKARMLIHKSVNLSHNLGLDDRRASDDVKYDLPTNKSVVNIHSPFYHLFINPADYALAL